MSDQNELAQNQTVSIDHFLFNCYNYETLVKSKRTSKVTPDLKSHQVADFSLDPFPTSELTSLWKSVAADFGSVLQETRIAYGNLQDFIGATVEFYENISSKLSEVPYEAQKAFAEKIASACMNELDAHSKNLITGYFTWSLAPFERKKDEIGERPPVGRFAPRKPREPRGNDRGDRGGKRGQDRGPRRDAGGRGPRPERGPRQDRGPRKDRGPRPDRGPRKPEISEADLLKEILKGCQELKSDGNRKEFALRPQNSFNRRRQHQLIIDEGFESQSSGEGDGRHVVIVRS